MRERPAQTDREWTSLGGGSGRAAICRRGWPHFYSARGSDEHLSRSARGGSPSAWATTAEEVKAFLGFLVLMGIQKLPGLYDYWSTDEVLHSFTIASRISSSGCGR